MANSALEAIFPTNSTIRSMKKKLSQMASDARQAVSTAAGKTADYVQTHKPTEQDLARARALAARTGKAVTDETLALGKQVAKSQTFKDAARGAGVGALVAVPIPLIGPLMGAVVGAGAGVILGSRRQPQPVVLPAPAAATPGQAPVIEVIEMRPKDLHTELLKLDELRQKGLLTDEEFDLAKQKLLQQL